MRRLRSPAVARSVGAAAAIGLLVLAPACGLASSKGDSILDKEALVIGVKDAEPGIAIELDEEPGRYVGFDVDVAEYIADQLGYGPPQVEFITANTDVREEVLIDGRADLVVATYSVTPERKTQVGFAGPYYVARQDILVRADDDEITNVNDLDGKRLCDIEGSVSASRIAEERDLDIEGTVLDGYAECVAALLEGDLDAVSTDDLILAGFLGSESEGVRFVNAPFTEERWGIGLPPGDVEACEAVNRAITQMYLDGTAEELLTEWFGATDLRLNFSVPQFEGCG